MSGQRRTVEDFDARAVGGPLDGLFLAFQRMSDGAFKIKGGQMFDPQDLAHYELNASVCLYEYREVAAMREP